jgi:hypothetical protein
LVLPLAPAPASDNSGDGATVERRGRRSRVSIVVAFALLAVGLGALVATCAR